MAGAVLNSRLRLPVCLVLIGLLTACAVRRTPVASKPAPNTGSPDFIDLQVGWRLRVVTPILKSGGYALNTAQQDVSGNTIQLTADSDFLGYELAYYGVSARRKGVRIIFTSAEITRDGRTTSQPSSVAPLFGLPSTARYVRLLFLMRISTADHDMAVVAADRLDRLNEFTRQIQTNPLEACKSGMQRFCSWIPSGISVNPEKPRIVNGAPEWVSAAATNRPPS